MDRNLFNQLLLEGERARLDYKSAQYPFSGASDQQKGEILKDIMAMANAWGTGDAFILIGVQDVAGHAAQPVGISEHLDDADLQQFVNRKTNRPILFSYSEFVFDQKTIAVVRIAQQQRPFFLLKGYGGLLPQAVYVRRGTSADIADPDEVFQMGVATAESMATPTLQLQFGDPKSRKPLGTSIKIARTALKPLPDDELPQVHERPHLPYGLDSLAVLNPPNAGYYSEMRTYVLVTRAVAKLGFVMTNTSTVLATGVRADFRVPCSDRILLCDRLPYKPRARYDLLQRPALPVLAPRRRDVDAEQYGDEWHVEVDFGSVQAGCEKWATDVLFFGTTAPMTAMLQGKIVGDNLTPVPVQLEIVSEPVVRPMSIDDLKGHQADLLDDN